MQHKTLSILLAMLMSMVAHCAYTQNNEYYARNYTFTVDNVTYRFYVPDDSNGDEYYYHYCAYDYSFLNSSESDIFPSKDVVIVGTKNKSGAFSIPNTVTQGFHWEGYDFEDNYVEVNYSIILNVVGIESLRDLRDYGGCAITSLQINSNVCHIWPGCISRCDNLTAISISSDNAYYKSPSGSVAILEKETNKLVAGCANTVIPEIVTAISDTAFVDCYELTAITIPASVNSIGTQAFKGCTSLASITVASGNQVYDSRNSCNAIIETSSNTLIQGCKNTVIPSSVKKIGDYAFSGCIRWNATGLQTIMTIPDNVEEIGNYAFSYCTGLSSVTIGNGVTKIGDDAFYECYGLTSIKIGNGVEEIDDDAFAGCSNNDELRVEFGSIESLCCIKFNNGPSNPLISDNSRLYINGSEVTSVTIPNSVTSIGDYTFYRYSGLTSVTIPNTVTSIGRWAFYCCRGLTSVIVEWETPISISSYTTFSERANATLYVPTGTKAAFEAANYWKEFKEIVEYKVIYKNTGDLNGDGKITIADVTKLVNIILGKE